MDNLLTYVVVALGAAVVGVVVSRAVSISQQNQKEDPKKGDLQADGPSTDNSAVPSDLILRSLDSP